VPLQDNEVLCHNVCVVIPSQGELGIESVLWENQPGTGEDVLPLVRPG
jgi:hypothetical protein